jgi:hypothetical protein
MNPAGLQVSMHISYLAHTNCKDEAWLRCADRNPVTLASQAQHSSVGPCVPRTSCYHGEDGCSAHLPSGSRIANPENHKLLMIRIEFIAETYSDCAQQNSFRTLHAQLCNYYACSPSLVPHQSVSSTMDTASSRLFYNLSDLLLASQQHVSFRRTLILSSIVVQLYDCSSAINTQFALGHKIEMRDSAELICVPAIFGLCRDTFHFVGPQRLLSTCTRAISGHSP